MRGQNTEAVGNEGFKEEVIDGWNPREMIGAYLFPSEGRCGRVLGGLWP